MKKVAISACLLGQKCKYNGESNLDHELLKYLNTHHIELIHFCPEDWAFGTPRPTMDLIQTHNNIEAICNTTGNNLTKPIDEYAQNFFDQHPDIKLFIGKSRSPSCGVESARLYDCQKNLISNQYSGIMANQAKNRGIVSIDSDASLKEYDELFK